MKPHLLTIVVIGALSLAACGGGGDGAGPPVADTGVPASAGTSPEAFTLYVGGLATSETAEPVDLGTLVPPASETAEPADAG